MASHQEHLDNRYSEALQKPGFLIPTLKIEARDITFQNVIPILSRLYMLKRNPLENLGCDIFFYFLAIQLDLLLGFSQCYIDFQIPVSECCYHPAPYHNQN